VLGRVAKLYASNQRPRFRWVEGLVESTLGVRVQIVDQLAGSLRRGHSRHQFEDFLPAALAFALKNHNSLMEPEDSIAI
jgi:hypothetical protein